MFSLSLYHCFSRAVVLPVPALELRPADRCGRRNRKGKLLNKRKLYCRRERERENPNFLFVFSSTDSRARFYSCKGWKGTLRSPSIGMKMSAV